MLDEPRDPILDGSLVGRLPSPAFLDLELKILDPAMSLGEIRLQGGDVLDERIDLRPRHQPQTILNTTACSSLGKPT